MTQWMYCRNEEEDASNAWHAVAERRPTIRGCLTVCGHELTTVAAPWPIEDDVLQKRIQHHPEVVVCEGCKAKV